MIEKSFPNSTIRKFVGMCSFAITIKDLVAKLLIILSV